MYTSALLLSAFAISALAFPFPEPLPNKPKPTSSAAPLPPMPTTYAPAPSLPPCSDDPVPCACPEHTFFQESSTYMVYDAAVADVMRVTGNFLETDWFGTHPMAVQGNGYAVGAIRTLPGGLPNTPQIFTLRETQTAYTRYPGNKGYMSRFSMLDLPFNYNTTRGVSTLGGTWEYVDVRAVEDKTLMVWNIHACFSDTFPFQQFHESAMNNVTAILAKQRKLRGPSVGPLSF